MKENFPPKQKKAKVPGGIKKKKKKESYFVFLHKTLVFLHKTLVRVLVNILYYIPFSRF